MPRVGKSSPFVRLLAEWYVKKVAGADLKRPIFDVRFSTKAMLPEVAEAIWSQYQEKNFDYFRVSSHVAQDARLKKYSCPMVSIVVYGQAPLAALIVMDGSEDDDDWELKRAVGLNDVDRIGAKPHLRGYHESCNAMTKNIPGTDTEAFEFTTELVMQEAPADAGPSAESASVKDALVLDTSLLRRVSWLHRKKNTKRWKEV